MSDAYRPSDNHWTVRKFRERVTKEQLQDVLMNRPDPILHGMVHEWKHRKVGPDVYEIWISEEPKDLS